MLNSLFIFAATTSSSASVARTAPAWTGLIFPLVLLVGLILMMILPQRKRNKQIAEMMSSIKPGVRVRTIGGIYGTVTVVKEDLVTIVSGPDEVKLVFAKGAIAVVEPEESKSESAEENADLPEETDAE